jgi:sporulation protein YlmC with PRC-barrel domain
MGWNRAGGRPFSTTVEEGYFAMKSFCTAAFLAILMAVPVAAQDAAAPAAQGAPAIEVVEKRTAVPFSGDVSAKELLDAAVVNSANETVGDINDVLIDRDGKIAAVIVGVGGFLGMGEKDVALPYDQLTFAKDAASKLVVGTGMTKESLQIAPEYVAPGDSD